jgi:hypothetical protein
MLMPAPRDDVQDLVLLLLSEAVRSTHIIDKLTSLISRCPSGDPVVVGQLHDALVLTTETRTVLLETANRLPQQAS